MSSRNWWDCASEGAAEGMHEPLSGSGGMLTQNILKSEASQSPEKQSNSLAR
jgi:hypothetical protein